MTVARDAHYALAVLVGKVDPTDPGISARLAIMKLRHPLEGVLHDLVGRAAAMHLAMLERDLRTADAAYLRAVDDGTVDCFASDVFMRLEAIHARYEYDAAIQALLDRAATAYADAAIDEAARVLAGPEAKRAINKARHTADGGTAK